MVIGIYEASSKGYKVTCFINTEKQSKAKELLKILEKSPYQNPPSYEKQVGDLAGAHSRKVSI